MASLRHWRTADSLSALQCKDAHTLIRVFAGVYISVSEGIICPDQSVSISLQGVGNTWVVVVVVLMGWGGSDERSEMCRCLCYCGRRLDIK